MVTSEHCTCGCPDGAGIHMCGCHVYDTPHMTQLREFHERAVERFQEKLRLLTTGRVSPRKHLSFARSIQHCVEEMMRGASALALENADNENGSSNELESWKE